MKSLIVALTAMMIAAVLTACGSPEPVEQPGADAATPSLDPDDPLVQDAQMVAEDLGISVEEAVQRLQIQQDGDFGMLQERLQTDLPETFGGLWIQHLPDYRIVIALTEGGEAAVRPYIEGESWADLVEVRQVEHSLAELEAAQTEAHNTLSERGVLVSSGVNVMENRVEVWVGNPDLLREELDEAGVTLPETVVLLPADPGTADLPPTNRGEIVTVEGPDGRTFYVPKQPPGMAHMEALIQGTLIEENGCLRVSSGEDDPGLMVLWPYEAALNIDGDTIQVLDGEGQVVGVVGQPVSMGGGQSPSADAIPGMPVEGCEGPYWAAGDLIPVE